MDERRTKLVHNGMTGEIEEIDDTWELHPATELRGGAVFGGSGFARRHWYCPICGRGATTRQEHHRVLCNGLDVLDQNRRRVPGARLG